MNKIPYVALLQPEQENSQEVFDLVTKGVNLEFPNAIVRTINDLQNIYKSSPQRILDFVSKADLVIGNMDGGNISVTFGLKEALSKSIPIILIAPAGRGLSVPEELADLKPIIFSLEGVRDQFISSIREQVKAILNFETEEKKQPNKSKLISTRHSKVSILEKYKHRINPRDPYRLNGTTLNNKYHLEGFIGAGGMGAVYFASRVDNNNIYAIKILKPDVAILDEKYLKLFENEAATVRKLQHPNVVEVFDTGIDSSSGQDVSYMVMEWFDGETLEQVLTNKKPDLAETTDIFKQMCDAVNYAHSQNILHLDIKPLNVMMKPKFDGTYTVKVIDFGMSKIISSESGTTVTQFRGTLKYCSPEHFGGKLTYRSDIYSLGATLYHMLAGVIPFGSSYINAKQNPNLEMPEIPRLNQQRPELPPELDDVIKKALSKDPQKRQVSALKLFQEFEKAMVGLPLEQVSTKAGNEVDNKNKSTNEKISNALRRIEQSRKMFYVEEKPKPDPLETTPKKDFPFHIAAKNDDVPAVKPETKSSTNFAPVAKPKLVSSLRGDKPDFDTNKLPPLAQALKISTSFEKRSVETPEKIEAAVVEPAVIEKTEEKAQPELPKIKISHPTDEAAEEFVETETGEIEDCAPFAMRFNAGVFDILIGSFASLILLAPFILLGGNWFTLAGLFAFLATSAIVMFVYMTTAIGLFGKTFGMKMFSLEIIDIEENDYPSFHQAAVSSSVYLLSLALGGTGFLTVPFTADRRAVHDIVSGTVIVREYEGESLT